MKAATPRARAPIWNWGSGAYIDGFEEQIVGHTPGETFDVNVTFPEDYGNADVAGKDAVFSTTLNYISETVLPELTDEWVQANLTDAMGFADVSELNAFVSNQISLSNQSGDVYSALYAKASFAGELPESAVNYYRDVLLFGVRNYAQSYGTTMTSIVNSGLLGAAYDTVEDFITTRRPRAPSTPRCSRRCCCRPWPKSRA